MPPRARRAARVRAALTAAWLIACGVLGLRHRAEVDHARSAITGALRHAASMTGHHDAHAARPDLHGRRDAADDEAACAIAAVHELCEVASGPAVALGARAIHRIRLTASQILPGGARRFRLAPKTSPPTA